MAAGQAGLGHIVNAEMCQISVESSAVHREECGQVQTHSEDFRRRFYELLDGGDAVVGKVVVVGQSVQTGADASLITFSIKSDYLFVSIVLGIFAKKSIDRISSKIRFH